MKTLKTMSIVKYWVFGLASLLCLGMFLSDAKAAEKGPIRIGFIVTQTGGHAGMGIDMVEAFRTYLEEINYTVAGRKIEFISTDSGDKPDIAIARARKLIDHEKVDIMAGLLLTLNAYAVAPVCNEAKIPLVIIAAGASDLTQRKSSDYAVRMGFAGCQVGFPLGDYAYKKLGLRKVASVAYDYGWGYEFSGAFQQVFEGLGGKVIQKMWAPNDCMDFGPYISNLKQEADGILSVISGASTVQFTKGLKDAGILEKRKLIGGGPIADEEYLEPLGDAGLGVITSHVTSGALNTAKYIEFKKRYLAKNRKEPSGFGTQSYTAAQWIVRAIEKLNGDVKDKKKLVQVIKSIEIPDSVRGPLKMDKYGQVTQNVYIRKIEKVKGVYQNTVMETYPLVSQFWTYDPETFMKTPLYSRDYPPCKFCQ